ncbi:MAG: PDZ domain-containing protein [Opitutae bacterium]|nr:PDZ domain-containing protein [Opitutae bacterium]
MQSSESTVRIRITKTVIGFLISCVCFVFVAPLSGQQYSEIMRRKQLEGNVDTEPLTLPETQPSVSYPEVREVNNIDVGFPEPELDLNDFPPHMTQLLGMLMYYTNGSVYIVYTNPEALHHQKGLRSGYKILSVNGKHVALYKDRFFDQLNEIRPERDIYLHCETGNSGQQKILILPNVTIPDRNLKKLILGMKQKSQSFWQPTISAQQASPTILKPNSTKPVRKEWFNNPQSETNRAKKQSVELFGMQASEKQGRLVVEGVLPRSAAAAADIGAGDEIISINDKPAARLNTNDLRQIARLEPVLIEWRSEKNKQLQRGYFNSTRQK